LTASVLRERGPLWRSRPAPVMLLASATDVAVVALLRCLPLGGVLMTRLPPAILGILFLAALAFALALHIIKRVVFGPRQID
jgi:hypothetical protein